MNVPGISRRRRVAATIAAVVTLVTAAGIVTAAPPANAADLQGHLVSLRSFQCLDVLGFDSSDGATIGQWTCNGASNQSWDFDEVGSDIYRIRSQFSGKCMDVAWGNYEPGARVIQYTCVDGAPEQRYSYTVVDFLPGWGLVVEIHPVGSPYMCLDVQGGNQNLGAPLGLWPCEGALEQQFILQNL